MFPKEKKNITTSRLELVSAHTAANLVNNVESFLLMLFVRPFNVSYKDARFQVKLGFNLNGLALRFIL